MTAAAAGALFAFLVFSGIGLGPALLADRSRALLRAPAVGLAVATIAVSLLVSAGLPIRTFAWPLAIALSLGSAFLAMRRREKGKRTLEGDASELATIAAVLVLLLVPLAIGGFRYWIARGNGTDAFNYAAVAKALQSETLSFVRTTPTAALREKGVIFPIAAGLIHARWSTSAVLGFVSTLCGVPAIQLTAGFAALALGAAAGITLSLARSLRIPRWAACLAAVAAAAGFWAQVDVDMSALSHLHSVPLLLLVFDLVASEGEENSRGKAALLVVTSAAVVLAYVEVLPLAAATLALFGVASAAREGVAKAVRRLSIALIGAILGFALQPSLLEFTRRQVESGANADPNWHVAYFAWLFTHPAAGFWGLHFLDRGAYTATPAGTATWGLVLFLVAAALTFVVLLVVFASIRGGRFGRAHDLVAAFAVAALLETVYVAARGHSWATGKSVTFAMPLVGLALAAFLAWPPEGGEAWRLARPILAGVVGFWLFSQAWLALLRVALVAYDREHPAYMLHHEAYRKYDWDLSALDAALADTPRDESIAVRARDPWLAEYVACALNTKAAVVPAEVSSARVVVVEEPLPFPPPGTPSRLLARNGSVRLVALGN